VDLLAALVVGLGHVEQHEQEPGGRERGERTPQRHGVRLDEDLKRFHDDERQGPGKGSGRGLYAATVQGRRQFGAYEPWNWSQAQPEGGYERAEDEQQGYPPWRLH